MFISKISTFRKFITHWVALGLVKSWVKLTGTILPATPKAKHPTECGSLRIGREVQPNLKVPVFTSPIQASRRCANTCVKTLVRQPCMRSPTGTTKAKVSFPQKADQRQGTLHIWTQILNGHLSNMRQKLSPSKYTPVRT